jgi:hypothetical protein
VLLESVLSVLEVKETTLLVADLSARFANVSPAHWLMRRACPADVAVAEPPVNVLLFAWPMWMAPQGALEQAVGEEDCVVALMFVMMLPFEPWCISRAGYALENALTSDRVLLELAYRRTPAVEGPPAVASEMPDDAESVLKLELLRNIPMPPEREEVALELYMPPEDTPLNAMPYWKPEIMQFFTVVPDEEE